MTTWAAPRASGPDTTARPTAISGTGAVVAGCRRGRQRRATVRKVSRRRHEEAGFTLLEILVVVVILGLLIGLVAPAVLHQLGRAKVSIAHQSIERLASVLDLYRLDVGEYPNSEQGLQALLKAPADVSNWDGPYLKGESLPLDPWNHPFVYRDPSSRQSHEYDLCSMGPNAQDSDTMGEGWICN